MLAVFFAFLRFQHFATLNPRYPSHFLHYHLAFVDSPVPLTRIHPPIKAQFHSIATLVLTIQLIQPNSSHPTQMPRTAISSCRQIFRANLACHKGVQGATAHFYVPLLAPFCIMLTLCIAYCLGFSDKYGKLFGTAMVSAGADMEFVGEPVYGAK